MNTLARRLCLMLGLGMLLLLQACATVKSADARDPWESICLLYTSDAADE